MTRSIRYAAAALLLIGFCTSPAFSQNVLNVGTSEAYTTISAALSAASSGDIINIVDAVHTEDDILVTKSVTIRGQGCNNTVLQAAASSGSGVGRLFDIDAPAVVTIRDLHMRYGSKNRNGGCIISTATLTIDDCRISECEGTIGGAVYVSAGNTTVKDCYILNCSASSSAGAFYSVGSLTLTNCTIQNNSAPTTYGLGGGGVYAHFGSLAMTNCTITGNQGYYGGALRIESAVTGTITNCTITANTTHLAGEGAIITGSGVEYKNNILYGNSPKNCSVSISSSMEGGNNLEGGFDCGCTSTGSMQNTNPWLLSLSDNGGATPTYALYPLSPAINPASSNGAPFCDQRSYMRSGTADIGAFEYNGILPVELVSFSARVLGDAVRLAWRTETETNNYGFEIERSTGKEWESVGFVPGMGTSAAPRDYTFTDATPDFADRALYRLKQIDRDGAYEYSNTVEVVFGAASGIALHGNYPNPFNPATMIHYTLAEQTPVTLSVYDLHGKLIETLTDEVQGEGSYSVRFSANDLPSGIYYYELQTKTSTHTRKMILNR